MLSIGTDIVLRPYDPYENFVGRSPFEKFMIGLGKRYRAHAKSMSSAAEWTAFPYEQAVADGLWLVFIRSSERLSLKLTTADHALRDIAPRVNRVLNNAFHFVYKTVDEAVDAFDRHVVQSVQNGDGAVPASEAWALTSAQFFADIIRAGNETAELITRLARKYRRQNILRPLAGMEKELRIHSGITDNDHRLETAALPISLEYEMDMLVDSGHAMAVIRDLKSDLRQVKKFKTLPYRLNKVVEAAFPDEPFAVSRQWVNTQMLLALAGAPVEAETVTGKQYTSGLLALKKRGSDEAVNRFLERMIERGMDASDLDWLRPVLADRIEMLRLMNPRELGLVDRNLILIDLFNEKIEVDKAWISESDPDSAMVYADQVGLAAARRAVIKHDWLKFTTEILEDHLAQGTLTTADVAANLGRLDSYVAEAILLRLLGRKDFDKKSFRRLVNGGHLELSGPTGFRFWEWLTPDELAEHLKGMLHNILDTQKEITNALEVYQLLRKAPVQAVRTALIDDPRGRVIGMILREELEAEDDRLRQTTGFKRKPYSAMFDRLVGREASRMFVLASEVTIREKSYLQPEDPDFLVPWLELHKKPHEDSGFQDLSVKLGLTRPTVAKLLKRHSEEDVLRWIYADSEPKILTKMVRDYLVARDTYYKARPSR